MGEVLHVAVSKKSVILECSDAFTDIDKHIREYQKKGFSREDIKVLLEDDKSILIDINTLDKVKEQLQILTSDVKETDSEEEKFSKIVLSIRKNIKYAHTKTGERNIGNTGNFVEGLLKGKCVCSGYAFITKAALEMHGIEAKLAFSDRHAWNIVRLGGNWYNWDSTNTKADVIRAEKMGRCLKTDEQIDKGKIYKGRKSDTECTQEPSDELISNIDNYIKQNKRNVPKLPKDNLASRLFRFVRLKLGLEETLKLPEPIAKETQPNFKEDEIEISKYSAVGILEDRNSILWNIQSWDKSDMQNKVQNAYVELPNIGNPEGIMRKNPEEFSKAYRLLLEGAQDYSYIGRIDIAEDDEGNQHFSGHKTNLHEDQSVLEKIGKAIELDRQRELKEKQNLKQEINPNSKGNPEIAKKR